MTAETGAFRYIARRRRATEHRRFLAGAGRFVADVALPGMLHVALVASPYPQARIVRIDTEAALRRAGRARGRHRRGYRARHRADDERPRSAQGAALSAGGRAARAMSANGSRR